MKIRRITPISLLILVGMACAPSEGLGQADPSWLRSWNEAEDSRPLTLASSARIAADGEAGAPLIVHGQVLEPGGAPAAGVVIHAYHRDHAGFDFGANDDALATWRLQGWVETDLEGRFEFRTIRPAPDHLGREGAHIHFTLVSDDHGRQWAPTVFLADDTLVTAEQRRLSRAAGKFGSVRAVETKAGVQHVEVHFRLKEMADF